jgi:hypothetical protein
MPCNDDEVDMNAPEAEPPCTPPKPTGNGGAGQVDPDGQMNSDSEDSDEPQSLMSKRKWNGRESWTMIKRWVTGHGKQSEMDQDDIDRELVELARDWMDVSKLKKLSCCVAKETDVAALLLSANSFVSTQSRRVQLSAILVRLFRCPLRHQCGFWQESATWRASAGCSSIGAASTMQTVTMKIKYFKYDA